MKKSLPLALLAVCLLLLSFRGYVTEGETITVDVNGGEDYTSIQQAINDANPGDTVFVYAGTYHERISLNKQISLVGSGRDAVIIDGDGQGYVVTVKASGASVTGCTIRNGGAGKGGVLLDGTEHVRVSQCTVTDNYDGIRLRLASNNVVQENRIENSANHGLYIEKFCSGNTMFHNSFLNNSAYDAGHDNFWYNATLNEGNYWDTYGGNDTNNDGIGDTPYPIQPATGSNFDRYPLMRPYAGINIFHLQADPQIQSPGGQVNISCRITSSANVSMNYINITLPNGTCHNTSMNRTGNTTNYHFTRSYTTKGTYRYTVWANDTNNNTVRSAEKKFVIANKPTASFTYTPASPTRLDTVTFNATSSSDPDGSIVSYTWNMGDGTTMTGETVGYQYSKNRTYTVTLTVTDNHGAWDTTQQEATIRNIPPVADFSFTPDNATVGEPISFTDLSYDPDGDVYEHEWSFGDGATSSNDNPTHAYASNGNFTVTLTVTDGDDGTDTMTGEITVRDVEPPRIENVSAYPNPQEIQGRVNVTCRVTDDVAVDQVRINITGRDPVSMHSNDGTTWWYEAPYNTTGNYSVKIWAIDPSGNSNTSAPYIFQIFRPAMPPEIHDVQDIPLEKQYGYPVNISCNASDNVALSSVTINVTLPDGSSTNTSMDPACIDDDCNGIYFHNETYPALGTYSYRIWATDVNDYVTNSSIHHFTIVDTMPPQLTNLSISPGIQQPNETVNVSCIIADNLAMQNVSITITHAGDIVAHKTMNVSSLYFLECNGSQQGRYNVTIHANDTLGNSPSPPFTGQFTVTMFPKANFTYSPAAPVSRQNITFTDQSSDPDGSITAWHWNFGDGATSTEQHPTHSYATDGAYTVTLTVTDNDSATATLSRQITVQNVPPTASFTHTPGQPTDVDIVTFNASGSTDPDGGIVNYTWNFGDNASGTGAIATHSYQDDGTYTVTLTVTDTDGASSQAQQNVTVDNVPPVADFGYAQNGMQLGVSPNASDPDGAIVNWTWNFGDGTIKYENTSKDVTHQYEQDGGYTVTLTVTDDDNATANATAHISVGTYLTADFTYTADPATGSPVAFYDNSSHAATWHWNFGDDTASNQTNPSHTYHIGNYYNVTLTVTNGSANASMSKTVPVDTTIHIVKNDNNVVNYIPWLGDNITASALASQIGSDIMPPGSVVSRWNTSTGSFDSYVVGVSPPEYDFVIHPYDAVVLRVAAAGTFTEQAYRLADRLVQFHKNSDNVANHVVWSSVTAVQASALASQIGGDIMPPGSVVSRWNTSTGSFDSYVVGVSPPEYDFVIHPGDCAVLRIAQSGQYHIEVKP